MRVLLLLCTLVSTCALAQQTILNIPSADVLDRSQIYHRLDSSWFPSPQTATLASNFIYGLGHNVEAGINLNAAGIPADSSNRAIVPNLKWKPYSWNSNHPNHLDVYLGNQIFLPTFHRTFSAGNYFYAAGAATLHSNTRFTAGGWNSVDVVTDGIRSGALIGLEQTVAHTKDRNLLTLAGDWQSGRGANGAVSLGVMVFPTSRLMLIPAFQFANSGDHNSNGVEIFIGYLIRKATTGL